MFICITSTLQIPQKFAYHLLPIETIYLVIPVECIDRSCSSTSTKVSHVTTISDEDVCKTYKGKKPLSIKNVRYFKCILSICTNLRLLCINTDVQPGNIETMIDVPLGNIETMIGNAALICSIIQKTIHIKYKWHNDSLCINMTIKYLNDL